MGAFIAKMLLPTVSSLVFLPIASVAAKRGFHMEAMVYFFTMFFTAVRMPLNCLTVLEISVGLDLRPQACQIIYKLPVCKISICWKLKDGSNL